jgi:hypothetical protein
MRTLPLLSVFGLSTILMLSCDEHDLIAPAEPFFPINDFRMEYRQVYTFGGMSDALVDTVSYHMRGDTVILFKRYKKITDDSGNTDHLIRVEGNRYYRRDVNSWSGIPSAEYVFLDASASVGARWWRDIDGYLKAEYHIVDKGISRTVLGKTYPNVIEVVVNYYHRQHTGQYTYWQSTVHYYAKDVGEIFSFKPYPVSMRYADVSLFLISRSN